MDASWREDACAFQRASRFWARAGKEALLGLETFWHNERWLPLLLHSRPDQRSENRNAPRPRPDHSDAAASGPANFKPTARLRHGWGQVGHDSYLGPFRLAVIMRLL